MGQGASILRKREAAPVASGAAPDGGRDDDLGRYPAEVDDQPSRTRVLERSLRSISLVAIVSGLINVALIMLIITILPLQQVYPYLVTFKDQDNQVVSIEPLAIDAPGILFATEDNVRDYVVQRHRFVPNKDSMTALWGPDSRLAARTASEAYQRFAQTSNQELEQLLAQNITREIEVNSVNRINNDTWQVQFTTIDSLNGQNGTLLGPPARAPGSSVGSTPTQVASLANAQARQGWTATMRVTYEPQEVTYDKRLLNPLGFKVIDYSVTRRN